MRLTDNEAQILGIKITADGRAEKVDSIDPYAAMSETQHQRKLIRWRDEQAPYFPDIGKLYAVPNGVHCSDSQRSALVAEGLQAGIPDLCLRVARQGYNGLYIELKTMDGTIRKEQRRIIKELNDDGYRAVVCRGWMTARDEILDYLGLKL